MIATLHCKSQFSVCASEEENLSSAFSSLSHILYAKTSIKKKTSRVRPKLRVSRVTPIWGGGGGGGP